MRKDDALQPRFSHEKARPGWRSIGMGQSSFPHAAGTLLRHDMKADRTGWTVYDAIDGRPICLGGVALVGLSYEDASEMTNMHNRQDLEIERAARRLVLEAMQLRSRGLKPLPARPS